MITQLDFYWFSIGLLLLGIINAYFLLTLWDAGIKAADKTVGESRRKHFLLPMMSTVIVAASFGMLLLGRSPQASTSAVNLHGDASPSQAAIETQLREEKELHLHTKQELAELRRKLAETIRKIEQEQFEQDVKQGEQHMLERRKQLMERDQ